MHNLMRRPAGCSDWTSSSRRSLPRFLGDYPEVSLDLRTDTMIDRVQEGGSTWRSCRHDRLTRP
jgi:hypothetical protein